MNALATGTVVTVAPGSGATLLSTARDCERVGAAALVVPPGTDPGMVAAVREHAALLVRTADDDPVTVVTRADALTTLGSPTAVEFVLDDAAPPDGLRADLHTVSRLLRALPDRANACFGARGDTPLPVLLAALSGGAHLRVGTADTPDAGRDDTQLVAMASGLARLAGRPPVNGERAAAVLAGR